MLFGREEESDIHSGQATGKAVFLSRGAIELLRKASVETRG